MIEPYSTASEQAIIGAILHDNSVLEIVTNSLKSGMFYVEQHVIIFKCIQQLYLRGDGVDIITLSNFEDITEAYLYECLNTTLGISMLKTHIGIVLEMYTKRVLLYQAGQIRENVQNQVKTGFDIAKEVSASLNNIIAFKTRSKIITPDNILSVLDKLRKERKVEQFIETNFPRLNSKLVTGFPLQNISVIAACASQGKSVFKSALELQMCERGEGVISIALEQTDAIELERKISYMSRVPFYNIMRDNMTTEQRIAVKEAGERLKSYNFHLLADRGASISTIRHFIESTLTKYPNKRIVFIDLFSYISEVMEADNTPQKITLGVNEMAIMSQEYNLHFCLLVHIKRDAEERGKKDQRVRRPRIHQILGSSSYQNRARLIFLLHRPKYYNREIAENVLEVNIAKQSEGDAGDGTTLLYDFKPEYFGLTEQEPEVEGLYFGEN